MITAIQPNTFLFQKLNENGTFLLILASSKNIKMILLVFSYMLFYKLLKLLFLYFLNINDKNIYKSKFYQSIKYSEDTFDRIEFEK